MAISLKELGRTSRTTKSEVKEQALLARLSALLSASLNTCLTVFRWNYPSKYLQSLRRDVYELLGVFLERTRSTITLASNSFAKCVIPSCEASMRLSLRAQNSAMMLVLKPMYLIYPLIHLPWESRMSPPPLVFLDYLGKLHQSWAWTTLFVACSSKPVWQSAFWRSALSPYNKNIQWQLSYIGNGGYDW